MQSRGSMEIRAILSIRDERRNACVLAECELLVCTYISLYRILNYISVYDRPSNIVMT